MSSPLLERYKDLYNIPIEALNLSEKALRVLKWHGITTIGYCVRFYILDAHNRVIETARLSPFMYGEVEPKLKAHGYWDFVMNPEIWQELRHYTFLSKGRVVMWQGQNLDLYNVPIEHLGLPAATAETLRERRQLGRIGMCIDYFIRQLNRRYRLSPGPSIGKRRTDRPEIVLMIDELEQALREQGYWRFVEDNLANEAAEMPPFPSNDL